VIYNKNLTVAAKKHASLGITVSHTDSNTNEPEELQYTREDQPFTCGKCKYTFQIVQPKFQGVL